MGIQGTQKRRGKGKTQQKKKRQRETEPAANISQSVRAILVLALIWSYLTEREGSGSCPLCVAESGSAAD